MCSSVLQVFPSRREYPKGVSGTGRGRSKMAKSSHRPHIKCDLGPVGLIQTVVSFGQRPYYREVEIVRSRTCAKASRQGKTLFVRRRQSSIKKDMRALRFPISCEPLVLKRVGF